VCGWEFPELFGKSLNFNPLHNQKRILASAESIWCWSSYTSNNLIKNGVHHAVALPPPVLLDQANGTFHDTGNIPACSLDTKTDPKEISIRPLRTFIKETSKPNIYLSVLNPHDKRKQIVTLIECFVSAWKKNNDLVLVIKLIIDNIHTKLVNINEILRHHYSYEGICKNVVFVGQQLSEDEMVSLYKSARYYLTATSAEGLNLPLIEAMSHGIVPITPRHTAMLDYINSSNSIIIEHENKYTGSDYHVFGEKLKTTHFPPKKASLIQSILRATQIDEEDYKNISKKAAQTVFSKYSLKSFSQSLDAFMRKKLK
jgi:glycosyltransferase involved in cell wall biosynthesis